MNFIEFTEFSESWQNPKVAKVINHLLTDTLPVLVIKSAFSLLPLGRYLLPVTTQNTYQSTGSSGKFFFTTAPRNVSIVRCTTSLVTILVLVFVMIHCIRWIQWKPFRKNSNIFFNTLDSNHCMECRSLSIAKDISCIALGTECWR